MGGERTKYTTQELLNINSDQTVSPPRIVLGQAIWNGSSWIADGGIGIPTHDYVSLTISPATTETYTFKTGGASGATVATVTVVYTDATRSTLSSVART